MGGNGSPTSGRSFTAIGVHDVLDPFARLHAGQEDTQLARVVRPPSETGQT